LLSNPHLLPCGNAAYLDCNHNRYNMFKSTFYCEICNQNHKLEQQLKPLCKSAINELLSENLLNNLLERNKNVISQIGNKFLLNCFFFIFLPKKLELIVN
jgi:hypothetical protein